MGSKDIPPPAPSFLQAQEEIFFDKKLKKKAEMKDFKSGDRRSKCAKTLTKVLIVSLTVVYILITPMIMAQNWCLDVYESQRGDLPHSGFFLDCHTVSVEKKIPYAGLPTATPALSAALDILCLMGFTAIKVLRLCRRKKSRYVVIRDSCFFMLVVISLVDIIISLCIFEK